MRESRVRRAACRVAFCTCGCPVTDHRTMRGVLKRGWRFKTPPTVILRVDSKTTRRVSKRLGRFKTVWGVLKRPGRFITPPSVLIFKTVGTPPPHVFFARTDEKYLVSSLLHLYYWGMAARSAADADAVGRFSDTLHTEFSRFRTPPSAREFRPGTKIYCNTWYK